MIIDAEKSGVESTSSEDDRVTPIGKFVRKFKLDELTQFVNVLAGQMSVVGPRPNTLKAIGTYSWEERMILNSEPDITDFASIVFSDEGKILSGSSDPDEAYNQLIWPWKKRLALLYLDKHSFLLDVYIVMITALSILSKPKALIFLTKILRKLNADEDLIRVSSRKSSLVPVPD